MSAQLVPCTYRQSTSDAVSWRDGLIAHWFMLDIGAIRIVVADEVTGVLTVCSTLEVKIHTGAQNEEHH